MLTPAGFQVECAKLTFPIEDVNKTAQNFKWQVTNSVC
jgi:hypothetical protein